jgi:hypothetical protein
MENLVPREIYDIDDSGYRQRLGLLTGIFFGLAMGLACLFLTPSTIGFSSRTLLCIGTGLFGGVFFGKTFPRGFRKRMSSIVDRLYAGDPTIDTPPPPGKDLRYRLPCSWKRSQSFTVGGVLYIGPQGLLFVPHKMNLPRDRTFFEMGPSRSLKLSLTPQKAARFFELFVPRPPSVLQVIWPDGSAQFVVPPSDRVFKLIEERIREVV